jgi:RNA polymerase sigma factor (sigma-70 family)
MNVHVSYKAYKTPEIENQINLQATKLRQRLQVFRSDLIHLHATVEPNSGKEGASISLNLRLPSGQMACTKVALTPLAAVKAAFDDLQEQVSRHKARLREKYKTPHVRRMGRHPLPGLPFEETMAAVKLPAISRQDIDSWVDANLHRLNRFIDRELQYRTANGQLLAHSLTREEVVDEAIAAALEDRRDKPDLLALEPWLYRLAMHAIDELARRNPEQNSVSLQDGTAPSNEQASDEAELQFHQPDGAEEVQDSIPDRGVATPEEIAYNEEMMALVENALLGASGADREAFLLFAVEGFSPEEIAMIGDRSLAQVRASIVAAREHLRKALPVPDEFKDKLLQHTRIA